MKALISTVAALTAATALFTSQAKTLRNLRATSTGSIEFVADSIEFRPDVTRLYGKLKGRPHTANRIDVMKGTFGKITYNSTDIDGVDMKRWFQWEDDGLIPVEIDFPVIKTETSFIVDLDGPRGESQWIISTMPPIRIEPKNKKR